LSSSRSGRQTTRSTSRRATKTRRRRVGDGWYKTFSPSLTDAAIVMLSVSTDKRQLTGQNLGKVFNIRSGLHVCYVLLWSKTAWLKVENLTQTTFRFSPVSFCAPQCYTLSLLCWVLWRRKRVNFNSLWALSFHVALTLD
jgi:hypothetical protein